MIKSINKTRMIADPLVEPQLVIFFPPFYCFHDILLQRLKYVLIIPIFIAQKIKFCYYLYVREENYEKEKYINVS